MRDFDPGKRGSNNGERVRTEVELGATVIKFTNKNKRYIARRFIDGARMTTAIPATWQKAEKRSRRPPIDCHRTNLLELNYNQKSIKFPKYNLEESF